jgi:uncharacterized protein (DUF2461 family)
MDSALIPPELFDFFPELKQNNDKRWFQSNRERYGLSGDSLKRALQGYNPGHPQIEDLKRKDFIAHVSLSEEDVCSPDFLDRYARLCAKAAPFMQFLTTTLGLPW